VTFKCVTAFRYNNEGTNCQVHLLGTDLHLHIFGCIMLDRHRIGKLVNELAGCDPRNHKRDCNHFSSPQNRKSKILLYFAATLDILLTLPPLIQYIFFILKSHLFQKIFIAIFPIVCLITKLIYQFLFIAVEKV
jgi:hypothetical protein